MQSDVTALEEIVVVGYGVQSRRDVSGSVSKVKGENLRNIHVQTFDMALQGKAAGVSVTVPNAVLGNPPVIRVRGVNSISGSSSPLYVIDGVPAFTGDFGRNATPVNPLADINPADIESIEVLKDASATAIYGSRAANGVVLVTTRRGQQGKVTVTYDASVGWNSPYRLYDLMDAYQFVETKNKARENAGLAAAYQLDTVDGKIVNTNWNDEVYRTGFQHNHALSVSGASPNTTYNFSAGYSNTDGIIKTNSLERRSFRFNIDHKISKAFSVGGNAGYTKYFC